MTASLAFDIQSLHVAYASGVRVEDVVDEVLRRIQAVADPGIFLHLESRDALLTEAQALGAFDRERKPLWGIPFAIKDNIDAAGLVTTAACPAYAYEANADASCVAALRAAGALLVGKTNLDQFATGLVGLRSPYPPPLNALDPELIPGGSSSGSAVAVSHGLVGFALGTDTAGSGRVPAAFNNVVGLKPTRGSISASGVVPACRSLDTVSVFALTVDDAHAVFRAASGFDAADPYAREIPTPDPSPLPPVFRVGVPDQGTLEFFGDTEQARSFETALARLAALGGEIVEMDFTAFYRVADMLYQGAWLAERYAVIEHLLKETPEAVHPVTRKVIDPAESMTAADAFRAMYRLEALKREVMPLIGSIDILCVPTIPRFYDVSDVRADPIGTNTQLGTYTSFANLLDLCGIAVPVAPRSDGRPGNVTLLAPAGHDARVATVARSLHEAPDITLGATSWRLPTKRPPESRASSEEIELAVVGAHMSGLPLNGELVRLGARFLRALRTAPFYRLYALAGGPPSRPGLVRDAAGASIALETWALPKSRFGAFIEGVPQPLAIGTVTLETDEQVRGFLCESSGLHGAMDITSYGGWRCYVSSSGNAAKAMSGL